MVYYIVAYIVIGLLINILVYILEEDEWEDGKEIILVGRGLMWPIIAAYILGYFLGYFACKYIKRLRARIHAKPKHSVEPEQ